MLAGFNTDFHTDMGGFKIGYDAKRLFCNNTGLGNYSRQLVANYADFSEESEIYLYSAKTPQNSNTDPFFTDRYKVVSPTGGSSSYWRSFGMAKDINAHNLDIFHGLSNELPFSINKVNCMTAVTVHDLIYKFHPEDFPLIDRKMYNAKFKASCRNADAVIAVSEHTKKDIIKHFGIDEHKISVIYQSCAPVYKEQKDEEKATYIINKYGLPPQYLLYVGSVIERKNLLAAVKAMRLLQGVIKLPLVVVGQGKNYKRKVLDYIKKHHLEDLVVFPKYVSNDDLPYLYKKARIFIYPSKYEGFGIPIIEALSSRTPVITSNITALPEAAGPGALYTHPDKPEEIADAIIRILTMPELYKQLINEGYNYISRFSPQKLNADLDQFYVNLMNLH